MLSGRSSAVLLVTVLGGAACSPAGAPTTPSGTDAGLDAVLPAPDDAADTGAAAPDAADAAPAPDPRLVLPGAPPGIGFDDLRFSPRLGRLLVPAGRTGDVDLIDPASRDVATLAGFSVSASYDPNVPVGATSADEGEGWVFVADKTTLRVSVVDPASGQIVASAPLASVPDYVRYVDGRRELWVSEPSAQRIEVLALAASGPPAPSHGAFVGVPNGPESLVIDAKSGRAYTNTWGSSTMAIDLAARAVVATWTNGCASSRGIAVDAAQGLVLAACAEGAIAAIDVARGAVVSRLAVGAGVDVIDFAPALRHLYAPASRAATMTFVGVSGTGELSPLGTVATAAGAHCVVADDRGAAWVCDPASGALLVLADPYAASR